MGEGGGGMDGEFNLIAQHLRESMFSSRSLGVELRQEVFAFGEIEYEDLISNYSV